MFYVFFPYFYSCNCLLCVYFSSQQSPCQEPYLITFQIQNNIEAFQILAVTYVKYIQIFRKLEECYDQVNYDIKIIEHFIFIISVYS